MEIKKIYIDMDGVLADFKKGIVELCRIAPVNQSQKTPQQDDAMFAAMRNVDHFYEKLDLIPGALEMFQCLNDTYDIEILSGIPKPKRGIVTAKEDKIKWVRRLLSEEVKVNIVYREEKVKFALGKEYILIDDFAKNIKEWNEAGGTGILFISPEQTLHEIHVLEKEDN